MDNQRLLQQIQFITEIDKIKSIFRQSLIIDQTRNENDAEHSWHLGVMAILLAEYANEGQLDLLRVIKMILIHDLVEIDAGDTFLYDETGALDKEDREQKAAERIFGLLPEDLSAELFTLWREFEEKETAEAKFATSLDRLHPLLLNFYTEGHAWKKHGLTRDKVLAKNKHIADGSKELWEFAQGLINEAVEKGYLKA